MIRKFFRYIIIGLLIGSVTYLTILLIQGDSTVTSGNILSIWLMSACIGLVSSIFELEWNFLLEMLIHFLVTFGLVMAMCSYNNWLPGLTGHAWASFFEFLIIYVAIWLGLYLTRLTDMKRLNAKIKERNQKN